MYSRYNIVRWLISHPISTLMCFQLNWQAKGLTGQWKIKLKKQGCNKTQRWLKESPRSGSYLWVFRNTARETVKNGYVLEQSPSCISGIKREGRRHKKSFINSVLHICEGLIEDVAPNMKFARQAWFKAVWMRKTAF